ncbi:MAG: cysteine--tRNA ligase [Actinomycetes bacterium]
MTHDLRPHPPLQLSGTPLPLVDRARVYVCGVTPYDVTHLGHAATYVWVDAATRVLRHIGVQTEVVRNVTDVDDVLTDAARRANTPYDAYAAMHQYQFDHDMSALSVRRPDHEPRAHRYIPQVIALAQALLDKDDAYVREGSVYFRGAKVPGDSGLSADEASALCREYGDEPDDPRKEHSFDVPVWRASTGDQPSWPSPWGVGRPGWHAECSAMALSVLGSSVDLHAGGHDLRFPHHAYEAAQAEAATGVRPFARAWMHVGTVCVGGQKMAKSTGNLVLVDTLLADHRAAAVRLLLLDRAWHEPWDFDTALLDAAEQRLDALYAAAGRRSDDETSEEAVVDALLADLDVPRALAIAEESGGRAARTLAAVLALT